MSNNGKQNIKRENWITWDTSKNKLQTRYTTYFKTQENGWVTAYIPAYQLIHSAPNYEEANKRSTSMVISYFKYELDDSTWKNFWLGIHKLGFKSQLHNMVMKNLINNNKRKGKMTNSAIEKEDLSQYESHTSKELEPEWMT